ncbi:DUF4062 domain-containing protein [Candidatus Poriferisodalis sp.]|uniref:DUF4062 domain-containing protein n=1 Tax=Candidatus Poriferisodalis sp. TaxID=3101277 RepID=UPI003B01D633
MAEPTRWRVFVSSVARGEFREYRRAAKEAIEALGHEPVVMEITEPSLVATPQEACLEAVADCDVFVLLLGRRYGDESSGKSPTHQEWERARELGKPILVFKEEVDASEVEERQAKFIAEVSDFESGSFRTGFSTAREVLREVVRALHRFSASLVANTTSEPTAGLPSNCGNRIEHLRATSPATASKLTELLSAPSARQAGALARMVAEPPEWLREAGFAAWEVLADFLDAYGLDGAASARQRAIDLGSPSSVVHLAHLAGAAMEDGDAAAAEEFVASMPQDHPLTPVMRAVIDSSPGEVVELVSESGLHESDDEDEALHCVVVLMWAYVQLEQFDAGREMLRSANGRFLGRGSLVFHQALMTALLADQTGVDVAASNALFVEVIDESLQARDLLRAWQGPSHRAVALAMKACLALGDPQRAIEIGATGPDGSALVRESEFSDVQVLLVQAWLMLGQPERIDTLDLRTIEEPDAAYIRAMQAQAVGDRTAPARMRQAVDQARDEEALRRALLGLAFCGQTDEERAAALPAEETAFLRALAASMRGDHDIVLRELAPYCFDSALHADQFARAQFATGHPEEAAATLMDAAEHLGAVSLRITAAEIHLDQGQLDRAEELAQEASAALPRGSHKHRAQRLLVHIAQRHEDWRTMEARALAWVDESPDDTEAHWAVVYAMHHQVLNRQAWAYITAHSLIPADEQEAALSIVVANTADMVRQDVDSVLDLGEQFRDSEQVVGIALMAIQMQGESLELDGKQQRRFVELRDEFVTRYPDSSLLQRDSSDTEEEFITAMRQAARNRATYQHEARQRVRYGEVPYGLLLSAYDAPYADILLSRAANDITSIPVNWEERLQECRVASEALRGHVVADTSIAVLGVLAEFDVSRVSGAFVRVLIPDELIYDARLAFDFSRREAIGTLVHDLGTGQAILHEFSDDERRAIRDRASALVDRMERWQIVTSSRIRPADYEGNDEFRPWDASIRLALERQVPLWCDDLALRRLARSQGIPAFGTWALYEVLATKSDWSWLPTIRQLQIQLLRARAADVPISVAELVKTAQDDDGSDEALAILLQRPIQWQQDEINTLGWYLIRIKTHAESSHTERMCALLYSACIGRGVAKDESERVNSIGDIVASTISCVNDPEAVPRLLDAGRQASNVLALGDGPDPLESAVRNLLRASDPGRSESEVVRGIEELFSQVDADDRQIVSQILVDAR